MIDSQSALKAVQNLIDPQDYYFRISALTCESHLPADTCRIGHGKSFTGRLRKMGRQATPTEAEWEFAAPGGLRRLYA